MNTVKKPNDHCFKWAIAKMREYSADDQCDKENLAPLLSAWDCGNTQEFFSLARGILPFYESNVFIGEVLDYANSLCGTLTLNRYDPVKTELDLPQVAGRVMMIAHSDFERNCRLLLQKEQEKADRGDSALIWILCEAVRLSREHCDAMTQGK